MMIFLKLFCAVEFARDTSDLSDSCSNVSIAGNRDEIIEYEPDSEIDAANHSAQSSSTDHEVNLIVLN